MSSNIIDIQNSSELKPLIEKERFQEITVNYRDRFLITSNDVASLCIELRDIFEKRIYHFKSKHIAPYIIDGGAHSGISVLYYKMLYPDAEILAFEPDKTALKYLYKNIEQNYIEKVSVIEKALYHKNGTISFKENMSDGGKIDKGEGTTTIDTTRLSPYLNRPVDMLKLNIEGAENEVFREIRRKLFLVKEIVFEYHGFPEFGQQLHKILHIFDRRGFRYIINHFDEVVNPAGIPPFRLDEEVKFFQLVYAKRIDESRVGLSERKQQILKDMQKFSSIVIAGAGSHTVSLLRDNSYLQDRVKAISTPGAEPGQTVEGIPLIDEDSLSDFSYDSILISSEIYEEDIADRLIEKKVEKDKIVKLYEPLKLPFYKRVLNFYRKFRYNRVFRNNYLKEMAFYRGWLNNPGKPRLNEFELTNHCPMTCVMCPRTYKMDREKGFMNLDLFKRAVDSMEPDYQKDVPGAHPVLFIYHYGETLLYPELKEAIKYAKGRGFYINLSANPWLITDEQIDMFVEVQLNQLIFMVDGMNTETLQKIRGKAANFEKGVEAIDKVIKKKKDVGSYYPELRVTMVPNIENFDQWSEFREYFGKKPDLIGGGCVGYISSFNNSVPEIVEESRKLAEVSEELRRKLKDKRKNLASYRCYYPWHSLNVLQDGRVVPCCRDYNGLYVLGDLNKQSIKEIWNGKSMKKLRKEIRSGKVSNRLCRNCIESNWELGSLGKNMELTPDMLKKIPNHNVGQINKVEV